MTSYWTTSHGVTVRDFASEAVIHPQAIIDYLREIGEPCTGVNYRMSDRTADLVAENITELYRRETNRLREKLGYPVPTPRSPLA